MSVYQTDRKNKNRGYIKLIVWQRGMELFELVWKFTFVETKIDFKLRSQTADAAQSVPANISEGYCRRSIKEYLQCLYIALGSLGETMTRRMGLYGTGQLSEDQFNRFDLLHYEVENRLIRLVEKLEQRSENDDWITRIAEDPEEYYIDSNAPTLHRSITPPLHHSTTPRGEAAHA